MKQSETTKQCGTGHASHEACELKLGIPDKYAMERGGHASHEACELKLIEFSCKENMYVSRLA